MPKSLRIKAQINALPSDVYAALTNEQMIEIWTGEPALMRLEPNTEFSWWDGDICGFNRSFEPDRKIVQDWQFDDDFSRVTIVLSPDKKGTYMLVEQENIPDEVYDNIAEGWKDTIIESLKELLEE